MTVLTRAQVMESERKAVESGTFSYRELMGIAGRKSAEEILRRFNIKDKKTAIICGKGNNGGDGFVIADILCENGGDITVITPFGAPETEDAKYYFDRLENIKTTEFFTNEYDIIIDALFGFSFNREPDNDTKMLFGYINDSKALKISVDVPSGVVCDSGQVWDEAIKADYTFTFIALKPCFMLPQGNAFCGEVTVLDIGVPPITGSYKTIQKPHFEKRDKNSHKGTFGKALIIAGSYGMAGAAMLSAKAALRSGLGIAGCVLPRSIYAPFTSFLPEAVCYPMDETQNGTLLFEREKLSQLCENYDAVLFGCGVSKGKDILKIADFLVKNCEKPLIIDADGINALADCIDILKESKVPVILTPHPGEMARLCKVSVAEIEKDRIKYAKEFATEYGCILTLKGSNTIVAHPNGDLSFNMCGNPGMATGGSGDVLSGIIVSLLAQGIDPKTAAENAVYLHAAAGDKAALKRSQHALLPSDIIEEL